MPTKGEHVFGLVVRFDLKEGSKAEFDALTRETVASIRTEEPGTLIYSCHAVEGEANARVFYELYRDRAAFEEHERQEHVRRFLQERKRYLAGAPRVESLSLGVSKGVPEPQPQRP
ncbi:MAG TPA: antibiotic biosynthesis monooxygenase [Actinomycetes bacterium]|nr:antibiotic biosynthesis monooxygenase [Actinomycetes bacterium]